MGFRKLIIAVGAVNYKFSKINAWMRLNAKIWVGQMIDISEKTCFIL